MRELSLNVMDIVQNSISANGTIIKITIAENSVEDTLSIVIEDNGRGMTPEQVNHVQDPFFTTRTTRRVGLGIPLFKMAAEQTGGYLNITSQVGVGTVVNAVFKPSNIDMTPLGDIKQTISLLIRCNPTIDFVFCHSIDHKTFTLDTREIKEIVGSEVSLDNPDVMEWINGYLLEQNELINGGARNL